VVNGHIGWVTFKVISRVISLDFFLHFGAQGRQSRSRETSPDFAWTRGGVAFFRRKPAITLKLGSRGQRLLSKFRTFFSIAIKVNNLGRPCVERSLCAVQNSRIFQSPL